MNDVSSTSGLIDAHGSWMIWNLKDVSRQGKETSGKLLDQGGSERAVVAGSSAGSKSLAETRSDS